MLFNAELRFAAIVHFPKSVSVKKNTATSRLCFFYGGLRFARVQHE
jgi:hypothetical protein